VSVVVALAELFDVFGSKLEPDTEAVFVIEPDAPALTV
jgi:hypothetical protein